MDFNRSKMMWDWSCKQLGISENSSKDEIKRAYHKKVKMLHPDASGSENTSMQYIYVQNAYEYLNTHDKPVQAQAVASVRPAKVFGNDSKLNMQLKKQKEIEKSKLKAKQWVPKENYTEKKVSEQNRKENKQTEEEILSQIRSLLFAEHIRRQIAIDKEKKEAERRTELYKAFLQHQILEDEEKELNGNN